MTASDEPTPAPPQALDELSGGLHWAVLVLWSSTQLVPLAVLLLAGNLSSVAAALLIVGGSIANVVRWRRFRWRLQDGTLVIERGLLQRQRRVIPVGRVQSVDLIRSLRHRLLGVVEVRVETVGGASSEGRLDALRIDQANRLRSALLRARPARPAGDAAAADDLAASRVLARMTPGRLVLAGVTGGRVGVVAALLGAAQQLLGDRISQLPGIVPRLEAAGAVLAVVLVVAVVFLLSVAATAVAYWDFTLSRDGDDLKVRRGLLEQRLETVPLDRVQALRVEENLLRRPLRLAAVKVDVAGRVGSRDARDTGLLLPLGTREEARRLVAELLDAPGVLEAPLAPMPRRARRRRLTRALAGVALGTLAAVAAAGAQGLVALVALAPATLLALDAYRGLGHGRRGEHLIVRSGVTVRRTAVVGVRRIQELHLRASPFQRFARLATLELAIARSPGRGGGARMIDVDAVEGHGHQRQLAAEVAGGAVVVGGGFEPP